MASSVPSTYKSVHLAKRPQGNIVPGETFTTKTKQTSDLPALKDGQVLFQTLYLSLDPAMRGWLNNTRSYIKPVGIGEVMRGGSVGRVLDSKSSKFPTGSVAVSTAGGWSELAVIHEKDLEAVEDTGHITDALSVLGLTGLTAYFGILRVGQIKPGDFVVVSGAAGATGSIVGQIAKLKGAKVLGIAGSDDKCAWLKNELGFDEALNYKSKNYAKEFRQATKDLIDVFFDNVGGETLDLALSRAKEHSTFVICGGISQYNEKVQKGPQYFLMVVSMRITIRGFVVFDFQNEYGEARKELSQWLREGKIKRKEYIVRGGLKEAEGALAQLFAGANTGKMLLDVAGLDKQAKL